MHAIGVLSGSQSRTPIPPLFTRTILRSAPSSPAAASRMASASASAAAPTGPAAAPSSDLLDRALAEEQETISHQHPNDARLAHKGHVKDVQISDVTVAVAGKELLNLTRLTLMQGARYGMVGKNGIGKSVLLKRIASGRIGGFPAHLKCYLVEQEVVGTQLSALETVMQSDVERTRLLALEKQLLKEAEGAAKPAANSAEAAAAELKLNEVYEALAAIDADSAEARAAEVLDEMQFTKEMQAKPTSTLSGGWRMRVALACALFTQPDILLLDEPTNHLDLHAVLWLTEYLQSLDITCVIVSHDSRFLSDVTSDTIHFHNQGLHYYSGNFDSFVQHRSEGMRNTARQQEALDSKRAHVAASIEKMQAAAKGGKEVKNGGIASRQKKLGRMGFEKTADGKKFNAQTHGRRDGCINNSGVTWSGTGGTGTSSGKREAISLIEPPEPGFRFSFPQPDMSKLPEGSALLTLKDVCFGFGDVDMDVMAVQARAFAAETERALLAGEAPPLMDHANSPLLFANLDFTVRAGQKIGIVGQNGVGKSTLLQLLCGNLQPTSGSLVINEHCPRVAFFNQHLVEALDARMTPVQHILSLSPAMASGPNPEQAARTVLGRFGLGGGLALAPIGTLSGGQRARCLFASITMREPNLIVLDEPTNHLDFVTIHALLDALTSFTGATLWVSHDQQIMECCNELWIVEPRRNPKQAKVNPNQLKAAAAKAQKEREKEAAAAKKKKGSASSSASSSSSAATAAAPEYLVYPSRSTVRKLGMSFEEYRESILQEQ